MAHQLNDEGWYMRNATNAEEISRAASHMVVYGQDNDAIAALRKIGLARTVETSGAGYGAKCK